MSEQRYAFLNGEIIPYEDARVHVGSVAFKFGTGVFEGLRAYWNEADQQLYVFRLAEHLRRLSYSQRFMRFDQQYDADHVAGRILELIRANGFRETIHLMVTVYVSGPGAPWTCGPVDLAIVAAPLKYGRRVEDGCRAQVSSWQRVPDPAMPMRVKANANYQNGRLATLQALHDGYDTAILLNSRGKVAEGPGMCLFIVRDGKAITPAVSNDILESITRDSVIELLRDDLDVQTVERDMDRSELVAADEAFFCGTAWEVTPLTAIDGLALGDGTPGPLTRALQESFFAAARGTRPARAAWRTPVYT